MTQPLESIKICGFRGIQEIELTDLGKVNILVGDNNSGKTSTLEAIALFSNPLDPFQWLTTAQRRFYLGRSLFTPRPPNIEAINWLFYQTNNNASDEFYQREMTIEAVNNSDLTKIAATLHEINSVSFQEVDEKEITESLIETETETEFIQSGVELEVVTKLKPEKLPLFELPESKSNNTIEIFTFWKNERFKHSRAKKFFIKTWTIFPAYTASEFIIVSFLSKLIKQGEYQTSSSEFLKIIREFDENIIDLKIAENNSLYIEHKALGSAPLYIFGDGLKRALVIALTILDAENGILLIDEVETSIHISAFKQLFSWLVKTCEKRNIQLFLTTHSLEVVDAILQTDMNLDHLVAYHLESEQKSCKRLYGDLLYRLRYKRGLEVR